MRPATETILRMLAGHLKAGPEKVKVVLGGFDAIPLGKEGVEKLAGDGLLCVVNLDPVPFTDPTQATREFGRWQEQPAITVVTVRRLPEAANLWGIRFDDGAWLVRSVADFCDRLEDPTSAESKQLSEAEVGIVKATLTMLDYRPGNGEDLADGFVSVGASLAIHAEVAKKT